MYDSDDGGDKAAQGKSFEHEPAIGSVFEQIEEDEESAAQCSEMDDDGKSGVVVDGTRQPGDGFFQI